MTSNTLRVDTNSSHCTTPTASDRERNDNPVSVKVGCLHINLATPRGRTIFMVQMLVLCFVPHAALLAQNCSVMAQLSQTLDASIYLNSEVSSSLTVGEKIAMLQEERLSVTRSFLKETVREHDKSILHVFSVADSWMESSWMEGLPDNSLPDHLKLALYQFRKDFMDTRITGEADLLRRLSVYGEINSVLLLYLATQVKLTTSALWRQLSACYELLASMEDISLALLSITSAKDSLEMKTTEMVKFHQHQRSGLEHLSSMILYLKADGVHEAVMVEGVYDYYKQFSSVNESFIGPKKGYPANYGIEYEIYLKKLQNIQIIIWKIARESVMREVWVARRTLAVAVAILTAVLLASPLLVLLIRHTVNTIQCFNRTVELSTQQLMMEKQKSDLLLSKMLPMPVLRRLRAQRTVPAEAFDAVTIFFSDIVGFTNISANSTPMEIINMLNMLYRLFDEKIMQYNVYKVETIGDAYMVVSGLPQRNGNRHSSEIADMSLSLMRSLDGATVPHRQDEALKIRAGINTGPCVAGVVGTTMPRYCLFGDTINVASRMESTGEAMKIHISDSTKQALEEIGGYEMESRGVVDVQGKGLMETFWLVGKVGGVQIESPRILRLHDYDQNILELLIKSPTSKNVIENYRKNLNFRLRV